MWKYIYRGFVVKLVNVGPTEVRRNHTCSICTPVIIVLSTPTFFTYLEKYDFIYIPLPKLCNIFICQASEWGGWINTDYTVEQLSNTHAHTRIHTCIYTHTCTHAHTHMHIHICTYTHEPTHMHIHTCTYTHAHTHTHTYTHIHTCTHTHAHTQEVKYGLIYMPLYYSFAIYSYVRLMSGEWRDG